YIYTHSLHDALPIFKNNGKSILLSSHILSEVERLADRVAIIRQGKIVESGTLDELRHLTRSAIMIETESDVGKLSKVEGVFDFRSEEHTSELQSRFD